MYKKIQTGFFKCKNNRSVFAICATTNCYLSSQEEYMNKQNDRSCVLIVHSNPQIISIKTFRD